MWFCRKLYAIEAIADNADMDLFCKMANSRHWVHSLLPHVRSLVTTTSDTKDIMYELPRCDSEMHKKSFVPRCFYKYM